MIYLIFGNLARKVSKNEIIFNSKKLKIKIVFRFPGAFFLGAKKNFFSRPQKKRFFSRAQKKEQKVFFILKINMKPNNSLI